MSPGRRRPITVFLTDDDARFRRVLRAVIECTPGFRLVGEAARGEDALGPVALLRPDLVLMDMRMPGIGGVATARMLVDRYPDVSVVIMSAQQIPRPSEISFPGPRIAFAQKEDLCPDFFRDLWRGRPTESGPKWEVLQRWSA